VFGVFSSLYQLASIVTSTGFAGLINDVVPRPVLGRFYGAFRIVSLLCGVFINYYLFKYFESHFRPVVLSLAGIFFVTFMAMCFMVRKAATRHPTTPPRATTFVARVLRRGWKSTCASASEIRTTAGCSRCSRWPDWPASRSIPSASST
jgi:MFS family permease